MLDEQHPEVAMFERYTEKARRVLFFARYEASSLGSPQIEPEHLLLGLLRENKKLLHPPRAKDGAVEFIRRRIAENITPGTKISSSIDLPQSTTTRRVLEHAQTEARAFGHIHIGTEHLLLGIVLEPETFAANLLTEQGLVPSSLREELRTAGNSDAPQRASGELPLSGESRDALSFAEEEAKSLGRQSIATEHLLLGVLRADFFAAKLLAEKGLTLDNLREELSRHHGHGARKQGTDPTRFAT